MTARLTLGHIKSSLVNSICACDRRRSLIKKGGREAHRDVRQTSLPVDIRSYFSCRCQPFSATH